MGKARDLCSTRERKVRKRWRHEVFEYDITRKYVNLRTRKRVSIQPWVGTITMVRGKFRRAYVRFRKYVTGTLVKRRIQVYLLPR